MKNRDKLVLIIFIAFVFLAVNSASAAPNLSLVYVIQQGDTLSEIASDFDISTSELRDLNEININSSIKMGDELLIPLPEAKNEKIKKDDQLFSDYQSKKKQLSFAVNTNYAVRINPSQQQPDISDIPEDKIIDYYVGPGDTLYDLARDFSTTIGTIMALNNKENNFLRSGEKLRLPVHNLTSHQILNKRVSRQELNLLARAVYGEARGEPYLGQVAVAAVIINRVLSRQFPNSFAEVIYQQGQFCVVSDGQINLTPNQQAYNAARDALNGNDPTNGALYFYNPRTATNTNFFQGRRVITKIGEHLFIE
ncbi:cell wall hydrolase [Halanaerobium hydrogeniformans]|uniref:Cell wall hydrolase SleB n=1 Tax=Halanaerobium hydrogeniformans TaxID=656519 RepID=E4RKS7_HALHG|nr:cell wall hydrolase [Halanaerobium hydrogeniformans]ADQ14747.1 cell wall hydrolase SleB [Halanaerobium hydrogeniformans]